MFPIPSWSISGVLVETRELKTKEGKVWSNMAKVAALGGMFELQTRDGSLLSGVAAGMQVDAVGTFESYNGELRLTLTRVVPAGAVAGSGSPKKN